MEGTIEHLTGDTFAAAVNERVTAVDFSAAWCGASGALAVSLPGAASRSTASTEAA